MKLPIGIQSFESLRKDGYLYIDKTELVYRLITQGRYYFLSRPRRFGKSLLISTIKAVFEGKRELFKGLAIDSKEDFDWTPRPILHLDLNTNKYDKADVLTDKLMEDINTVVYKKTMEYRAGIGVNKEISDSGNNKAYKTIKGSFSDNRNEYGLDDRSMNENGRHISKEALSYAMAAQITREDRLLALKLLSGHYDVKLFSREQNQLLDKVTYMGTADYDSEMPMVFKASDINLNMTLRCIKSGIPLRALDIMGAGGFLLSNYQPELAECFIDGEEVVMYESIEDMYAKVSYYLANPDLRTEIARRGHAKVS